MTPPGEGFHRTGHGMYTPGRVQFFAFCVPVVYDHFHDVSSMDVYSFLFFQAKDGIRDIGVTRVQTCALPIFASRGAVTRKRVGTGSRPRSVSGIDTAAPGRKRSTRLSAVAAASGSSSGAVPPSPAG